jgi:hypothetical protein
MALITSNGQHIRLARRKPVNMRMQGAYQGADGEPGQGLQAGMFSRKPEDSPLRGPYETGCVSPGTLCYDTALQRFRADRVLTVMLREEYIPPVTLKQVACGHAAIYGLLTDGTVIMCGSGLGRGESDCEDWTDIAYIAGDYGYVVGVKEDGSVVVAGEPFSDGYTGDFAAWSGVVKVSAAQSHCVALTSSGSLLIATADSDVWRGWYSDITTWAGVVDVSDSNYHVVACFPDGHVQVGGRVVHDNVDDVGAWTDVVAVATTFKATLGLKSDGSCLACGQTGSNKNIVQDVSGWTGITAFHGHGYSVLGIKEDKTVVHAGEGGFYYGTPLHLWTDILQVANYGSLYAGRRSCDALALGGDADSVGDVSLLDHCL